MGVTGGVGRVPRGASVSGHRHFRSPADEEEEEEEEEEGTRRRAGRRGGGTGGEPTNALRIWDYACSVLPLV